MPPRTRAGMKSVTNIRAVPRLAHPGLTRLSDVTETKVDWLVPGYFPRGAIVTLDGDPSTGKSTLLTDLAAAVTTGRPWPYTNPRPKKKESVLLLSAEDRADNTIKPRFLAAGGDDKKAIMLNEVPLPDGTTDFPELSRDLAYIEKVVKENKVALMVVDVLFAFIRADANRDQAMRRLLTPMAKMAERTGCCIVLIRHIPKTASKRNRYRGAGSIGIVGAARAGYEVYRDPGDEEVRVMRTAKNNIAVEAPPIAYRLVDDETHDVAKVEWQEITVAEVDEHAEQAEHEESIRRHTKVETAAEWLLKLIETEGDSDENGKGLAKKKIISYGKDAEYGERLLERAALRVGIYSTLSGFPGVSTWYLPEDYEG